MRKLLPPVLFALLFVGFAAAMIGTLYSDGTTSQPSDVQISVILYGSENNNRWKSLDQGIQQACRELGLAVPTLNSAATPTVEQQRRLIEREVATGTRGLLIAPEDSDQMAAQLESLYFVVPTVFIQNGIDGYDHIGASDAGMAEALADELAKGYGRVVLLMDASNRDNLSARREAFAARLQELGIDCDTLASQPGEDMAGTLIAFLAQGAADDCIVVALDTETLEKAADVFAEASANVRLGGIGSSDKVVYALNIGVIDCLVYPNEYALGYIATRQLAAKMGLIPPEAPQSIQYMYVNRETMFEPEAERLLFPISQ